MYLANNKRAVLFRCSVIINVAVLLYAAVSLTNAPGPHTIEWVPQQVEVGRADRSLHSISELSTRTEGFRNYSSEASVKPSKYSDETTISQKSAPTSAENKNVTASSTVSLTELEKKIYAVESAIPSEPDPLESSFDLDQQDENALSEATLMRLKLLLGCQDKAFLQMTKQRGEFWSLVNYVRADHGIVSCHESVTYTTHAGFEFLDNVLPLVERWMAPVSLAVHAPGADMAPAIASIRYLRDCTGSDLIRNFVTFHVFFSHSHIPTTIPESDVFLATPYNCLLSPPYLTVNASATYKKQKSLLYPVNVARNIAREAALTHYILPSDIELYPSPSLAPRFLNMIARNDRPLNTSTKPRIFPISIFEVDSKVNVPSTKTELQKMLSKKTSIPFHKFVCPNCHNIPMADKWIKASETEAMAIFHVGKRRGKYVHWEPIFIGTNMDPFYDERLSWEGKQDKMTQGYILCVKDYDFMILNNAFIVHKPGIKKYSKDSKRDSIAGRQNKLIKSIIFPELKRLFGTRTGCAV